MCRATASFSPRPSRSTARATTPSRPSARTAPRWLREPFGSTPTPAPFGAVRRCPFALPLAPFRAAFLAPFRPCSRTHCEPSTAPASSLRRSRALPSPQASLGAGGPTRAAYPTRARAPRVRRRASTRASCTGPASPVRRARPACPTRGGSMSPAGEFGRARAPRSPCPTHARCTGPAGEPGREPELHGPARSPVRRARCLFDDARGSTGPAGEPQRAGAPRAQQVSLDTCTHDGSGRGPRWPQAWLWAWPRWLRAWAPVAPGVGPGGSGRGSGSGP